MSHDGSHDGGHDACGPSGHGHHSGGLSSSGDGHDGGRRPTRRGLVVGDKSLTIDFEFHRACDLKLRFKELARGEGLIPIDTFCPILCSEDAVKRIIVDNSPWEPPDDEKVMPNGWYPNANGWTRQWREFWQIGKRRNLLKFYEPLTYNPRERTYLDVSCVTWYFRETGDMQSRFIIDLKVHPMWVCELERWVYDGPSFDRTMDRAKVIANGILRFLQEHPASPESNQARERIRRTKEEVERAASTAPGPVPPVVLPPHVHGAPASAGVSIVLVGDDGSEERVVVPTNR
jgi:hypothetical protein